MQEVAIGHEGEVSGKEGGLMLVRYEERDGEHEPFFFSVVIGRR